MGFVTTKDGTEIFYEDWGDGPTVVLCHGWPLSSDSWDPQIPFLASNGFRCVAHDRRGHGRSTQSWDGNEMNTYADDLAALVDTLDLRDSAIIGFSTGGGEAARYLGRHGTDRVSKAVLISAVPLCMLKTDDNPDGVPIEEFDELRASMTAERVQTFRDLADGPSSGATTGSRFRRAHATSGGVKGWLAATATCTSASPCTPRLTETCRPTFAVASPRIASHDEITTNPANGA